jgi:hypothetical protein
MMAHRVQNSVVMVKHDRALVVPKFGALHVVR